MIATLAKMLGLTTEHAQASMFSERSARAVLTRRNLFAAGAALATGSAFSFAKPEAAGFWVQNDQLYELDWLKVTLNGMRLPGLATFTYTIDGGKTMSPRKPIPASGRVDIPGTGLTLTFPPPYRSAV